MMRSSWVGLGVTLLSAGIWNVAACAASDTDSGEDGILGQGGAGTGGGLLCQPYSTQPCECMMGDQGIQTCSIDGSNWGPCECGTGGAGGFDPCGNSICESWNDEDCHTCEEDCDCEPCLKPACNSQAQIAPADLAHYENMDFEEIAHYASLDAVLEWMPPELIRARLAKQLGERTAAMRVIAAALDPVRSPDEHALVTRVRDILEAHPVAMAAVRDELAAVGMESPAEYRSKYPLLDLGPKVEAKDIEYPGGDESCGRPFLRVGVSRVKVHEPDDPWPSEVDEIYCIIQSDSAAGGEIRVTPLLTGLGDGDSKNLSNEAGVFFGQLEPKHAGSNIEVVYDCIENDDAQAYTDLLDNLGDAAIDIGGAVGGQYGWIIMAGGGVAQIVGGALSLNGDDQLFNVVQNIPLDTHMDLVDGVWWSVRQGDHSSTWEWDYELTVRAWGCAEFGGGQGEGGGPA